MRYWRIPFQKAVKLKRSFMVVPAFEKAAHKSCLSGGKAAGLHLLESISSPKVKCVKVTLLCKKSLRVR